jgi:hypothetical protein
MAALLAPWSAALRWRQAAPFLPVLAPEQTSGVLPGQQPQARRCQRWSRHNYYKTLLDRAKDDYNTGIASIHLL